MSDNSWDNNNQDNSGSLWPTLSSTGDAFNLGLSTTNGPVYSEAVRIYGEAKANAIYEGIEAAKKGSSSDQR